MADESLDEERVVLVACGGAHTASCFEAVRGFAQTHNDNIMRPLFHKDRMAERARPRSRD